MSKQSWKKGLALTLAYMLWSAPLLQAQDALSPVAAPRQEIMDVSLDASGALQGQLVDPSGNPLDGARLVLSQNDRVVSTATTDHQGTFRMGNLAGGLYRLDSASGSVVCRVWNEQVAPPSAKPSLVMVNGDQVVRGQFGGWDLMHTSTLLLGVAAVTLSAITLSKVNDIDKCCSP